MKMRHGIYNLVYLGIFLEFLRKTYEKLVENYQLGISFTSNDGEGCYAVVVGNSAVYSTYSKSEAWHVAATIKKALPNSAVQIIEDDTLDGDPGLESTGLNQAELVELQRILERVYAEGI